ncbi:uncharacterized protein HD556DRAFT_1443705 [Suillus plorans]|uniref:Uncharacterized protein n=1 Tax=Suillus plorans TaxID=116603 RepID=A0A9P7AQH9_9AGAM|nr:uncharacterized protein HD556DRAFT_1443705 [Suillus plorans]KAG1793274.1 hypothetical protein HD556DRAFT_1443705 [Suillus plorans]
MSPSIRSKSKPADLPLDISSNPPRFTLAGTAALYSNMNFTLGFSNTDRQAAARALLRSQSHLDGTHYHTWTPNGLHPKYIAFNDTVASTEKRSITHAEFVDAALEDVFDALTTQDCLDGGFSLLIHCPGSHITGTITPERIAVDLYVTPRELHEASEQIGGDVSVLVQAFCQEFAVPHIKRFMERCCKEEITPPHRFPATPVNPTVSPFLPAPLCATSVRIQCSAHAPAQLQHEFVLAAESSTPSKSSAVKQATTLATGATKIKQRRRNAEAFSLHTKSPSGSDDKVFGPPLISIGPNTDAVLDRFKIGDQTIPRLHELIATVRSSRWETVLRSPKWDFTYEQASNLMVALHVDFNVPQMDSVHKISALLSVVLKLPVILASVHTGAYSSFTIFLHLFLLINGFFCLQPNAMVSQTLTTAKKHVQHLARIRPKVRLSKEVRALLTAQRCQKSRVFKAALDEAWLRIDESVKTIASSHHKSIRRVQNDLYVGHAALCFKHTKSSPWNAFCWKKHQQVKDENCSGKAVLQSLLHDYTDEYRELSQEEKDCLINEYDKSREHKTKGIRAIENELIKLRCRTGVETIFYSARGSTNLALKGIIFATEGVNDFMESTMSIDNQDLVSKMEGYAMQGMREDITGIPKATMQWTEYWRNTVQRYNVVCEGWPSTIPFKNLSEASSALSELRMLLNKWESGAIKWRYLEEEEYERLLQECLQKIDGGEIIERTRRQRSDKGKKRAHTSDNPSTHRKKAYKSADTIESDEERDSTPHTPSTPSTPSDTSISISAPSVTEPSTSTLSASGATINEPSTSTSSILAPLVTEPSTSTSSVPGTAFANIDDHSTDIDLDQVLERLNSMVASGHIPDFNFAMPEFNFP